MVHVMQLSDRLPAEHAILSLEPLRGDVPDKATLGIDIDLLEAVLIAILPLRPSRTLVQAEGWLAEKRS